MKYPNIKIIKLFIKYNYLFNKKKYGVINLIIKFRI